MKWIGALAVVVAASYLCAFASNARATSPLAWWTSDHAEAVLMDSDWSFAAGVDDASCAGWGAYKLTTDGGQLFRRFTCTAYAETVTEMCLPGECASDTATSLCTYRLRIQATGAESFLIVAARSSCS